MVTAAHPITVVGDCRRPGTPACRPTCSTFNGRLLRWDEARVMAQIQLMSWIPEAARADLAVRAIRFLAEQGERIRKGLMLESPVADKAALCGGDHDIAAARKIVDLCMDILLSPGRPGQELGDVISHRRHVAISALRHAEERVRHGELLFSDSAKSASQRFQVTPQQVASMMDGRPSAVMTSIDPHGALRREWRELRARKAMVEECRAVTECLNRFIRDHNLEAPLPGHQPRGEVAYG